MNFTKIHIIPTCVNLSAYRNRPVQERQPAVLHMGTVGYKNPLSTLRAFALVRNTRARCYVTGNLNREIDDFVSGIDPSIRKRIEFVGFVSAEKPRALLGSVRVISVPSRYWVLVASPSAIEGLASGTPVIGSPSISRDVLKSGVNGYICEPENHSELAAHMDRLLEDDQIWTDMSLGAQESAKRFSSDHVSQEYLSLAGANYLLIGA